LINSARRSGLWFKIRTLKNSNRGYWWLILIDLNWPWLILIDLNWLTVHEDLDFDLKSGLLKNSNLDYWWCVVHSKCHWNCIWFFSLKTTYIVMNCHWLLIIIWDTLITYFMQKTWEVVFYNYWLDLIRVTYLFYNCLVL